jgi:hypothetical protein
MPTFRRDFAVFKGSRARPWQRPAARLLVLQQTIRRGVEKRPAAERRDSECAAGPARGVGKARPGSRLSRS